MSKPFVIALALMSSLVMRAQDNAPLQPLPFKSRVEVLSADGKQVVDIQPPKKRAIAGVWSLADENITTEITSAYRYHDDIIAFGWAGNFNGVVTIIDATFGREKLELLVNERSRFITPGGLLLYEHWFVKGAYEPDDSLWMLDLNRPFPRAKSALGGSVAEESGVRIYPVVTDPKVRHRLGQPVVTKDGRDVFLADRPVNPSNSGQVCFVRINVSVVTHPVDRSKCVDETILTGSPPGAPQITALAMDETARLVYSVTSAGGAGKKEEFTIDKDTLSPGAIAPKTPAAETGRESGVPPLRVPWQLEKQSLTSVLAIDLGNPIFAGHGQDNIAVRLVISETGSVRKVSLSGCTGELKRELEGAIHSWSFRPTILNGRHTEVEVQFEALVSDLAKTP